VPVAVAGDVGPKPVAKRLTVSPGFAGELAVIFAEVAFRAVAMPVPVLSAVKSAGAKESSTMLTGGEVVLFTFTVMVVAPTAASTGNWTRS
jgi:hypothetical protein